MSTQGITIAEAAVVLNVSTRTVRRFIKAGKLPAKKVPGPFGDEYRILEDDITRLKEGGPVLESLDIAETDDVKPEETQDKIETPAGDGNHTVSGTVQVFKAKDDLMDLIKQLEEKNLALAAQLGAAGERIRNLENQVRQLSPPKIPWWKRIFQSKS